MYLAFAILFSYTECTVRILHLNPTKVIKSVKSSWDTLYMLFNLILDMPESIYQHLKILVWMKFNSVWFYLLSQLIQVIC